MNNTPNQINYYCQIYLQEAQFARCLQPETLRSYRDVLKNFLKTMPEVQSLNDLSSSTIVEFYKRIHRRAQIESREVKRSTIYTYHSKLNAFFKWLEHQGYLKPGTLYNKVPKPQQPHYSDVKALSKDQIESLIATISLANSQNDFLRARDIALFYTLIYTGIRRGELLGLRTFDIDFDQQLLSIKAQSSKSGRGRHIPMNPLLTLSLRAYFKLLCKRKSKAAYLFISSKQDIGLTTHGLKAWVEKYKALSGVSFSTHSLRHTFATSLAQNNADIVSIKSALGHSSVTMTDRYVRSIGSENARVYIDKLSF